tara:strand:- start:461 stop:1900 length:1440 start_codon:yes stop_codon:yes gene_type:complete
MNDVSAGYRYEVLAQQVMMLIDAGALAPGARAPSLRDVSKNYGVSLSTAIQAYKVLEDRGYVRAREKSGYFVVRRQESDRNLPLTSNPPIKGREISLGKGLFTLIENAANPDFVPLGGAIPSSELLSAQKLDLTLARIARAKGGQLNVYTDMRGDPDLRRQISLRAMKRHHHAPPSDIVITNGCTEALSIALQAVTQPGDTVVVESPTYFGHFQILKCNGLQVMELPCHAQTGVVIESLEKALKTHDIAACLLSSSFNNPLGGVTSEDDKRSILDILARHKTPLIEDDIYGELYFGDERPVPYSAITPNADVIYCNSFSKTLAPGYRIGWVASARHVNELLEKKFAASLCTPTLPQAALAEFLSSAAYDTHLRRVRRAVAETIHKTQRAVEDSFPQDTRMSNPAGGASLWLEMNESTDTERLYDLALSERICFAPGTVFTSTDLYRNCLRLNCANIWDSRIERGVRRIGALACQELGAR